MFNKDFSNNVTEFLMLCQRDRGGQSLSFENFEFDTFLFLNNFVLLSLLCHCICHFFFKYFYFIYFVKKTNYLQEKCI